MRTSKFLLISFISVLFIGGGLLRLQMLGRAPFPADEIEFYKMALRNQSIVELWQKPPWVNQIPLNETLTLLMVKVGLPPTPFVTRLPFAIMGCLTLVFMWTFARRFFGLGAACVVLLLAVLNPYQLFYARTAYHYAGATCWSAAMFFSFWQIRARLTNGESPLLRQMVLWLLVAVLACHMHMSVWIIVGLQGVFLVLIGFWSLKHDRTARNRFLSWTIASGGVLALIMSRWIYRALKMIVNGDEQVGGSAREELIRLFPAYFAGENMLAVLLLLSVAGIAFAAFVLAVRRKSAFAGFGRMAMLHIVALMLYVGLAGGGIAKITYFSAIWPLFIWFLGIGLWQGLEALSAGKRWIQYSALSFTLGAYVVLTLPPDLAIVNLDGKPLPTLKINDWVLQQLPEGTPVLVDHWLHPWNHLAVHNSRGINYTFTVPDEPLETYRLLKWRDTAELFFEKYPQAALLEVARGRYDENVGLWAFPEQHFARTVSITNNAAMTLRKYRVYPKSDFATANTNQVVTRIFYNTPEDLMAAARREGRVTLRLYGEGWRFLKPWQPMQGWPDQLMQLLWIQAGMYRDGGKSIAALNDLQKLPQQQAMQYLNQGHWADYRIPGAQSKLRLFNLTEQDLQATLTVTAIALSGNVRCMIGDKLAVFPQTLMTAWRLPVTLAPGENQIVVAMPMNQFLLVHDVQLTTPQE